jgi:hypothetical protein
MIAKLKISHHKIYAFDYTDRILKTFVGLFGETHAN